MTAPVISAGVIMANIIWNTTNNRSGIGSPSLIPIPERPNLLKSPMYFPDPSRAKLYPHNTHTTLTTAIAINEYIIVLTTFLAPTIPP